MPPGIGGGGVEEGDPENDWGGMGNLGTILIREKLGKGRMEGN